MKRAHCTNDDASCVGFIRLVFFDAAANEVVTLGGAGFVTPEEDASAWRNVPRFPGMTCFQADRLNAARDIIDERPVSAETCERLMGRTIAAMIREGRAALAVC
ncbi:hypothetical protein [Rhodanobacter denitrificans]|uniref:Uncharacterized protein n=1 Tax=Rhodanobacter denitrificans TaxID=666685 RepID=M4NG72_9GAMM|nr:hypothetical protein [Rhodanobacter denitrificans]AGG89077.1 hypothetical protein R2APBS1_1954 [Rhodanobacter denitrificans]UJJ53104.1 hypothetical protein LRK52_18535 [Rhodanobacter denitrificans]